MEASKKIIQVFWVEWFHRTPHINLTLHQVGSKFEPTSSVYQESLGIIGSVPAGILILTLLILLLYLLTRCCDTRPRKAASITCLKVTLVLFALFTLGALGVSIWGNEEVHDGVAVAVKSIENINSRLHSLSNLTKLFDETIRHNLQPQLNLFKETILENEIENTTTQMFILESLNYMMGNVSEILLINVEDINTKMARAELGGLTRMLDFGETIRWVATIGVTGLLMMFVFVLIVGVAMHSRCTLITFSVLGLLSMIVCWGLASVYLVVTVGLSDWCMDPNPFLDTQLNKIVADDVAVYYLRCDPTMASPFARYLTHAQQAADLVLASLIKVTKVADQHYPRSELHPRLDRLQTYLNQSERSLAGVTALLECQPLHSHYLTALNSTCHQSMSGVVYLLLSAAGSGLLFTLLVWFTSHTWIYLNHKRESGSSEERDPFLPGGRGGGGSRGGTLNSLGGGGGYMRPRHSHTPPQTPPFPGTLNGRLYHSDGMAGLGGNGASSPATVGTLGRDSQHHNQHHNQHHTQHHNHNHYNHPPVGPNQGQYATLSKQCKTLESSDFY